MRKIIMAITLILITGNVFSQNTSAKKGENITAFANNCTKSGKTDEKYLRSNGDGDNKIHILFNTLNNLVYEINLNNKSSVESSTDKEYEAVARNIINYKIGRDFNIKSTWNKYLTETADHKDFEEKIEIRMRVSIVFSEEIYLFDLYSSETTVGKQHEFENKYVLNNNKNDTIFYKIQAENIIEEKYNINKVDKFYTNTENYLKSLGFSTHLDLCEKCMWI